MYQALHRSFWIATMLWLATMSAVLAQDVSILDKPDTTAAVVSPEDADDSNDDKAGKDSSSGEAKATGRPEEEARRTYMDRIVAAPMSHLGASWLVRPERQAEENAQQALQNLGLTAGMKVCDIGCGNGYWTLMLADSVGKEGWYTRSIYNLRCFVSSGPELPSKGSRTSSQYWGLSTIPRFQPM